MTVAHELRHGSDHNVRLGLPTSPVRDCIYLGRHSGIVDPDAVTLALRHVAEPRSSLLAAPLAAEVPGGVLLHLGARRRGPAFVGRVVYLGPVRLLLDGVSC
jgi:hypothetical protein